MRVACTCTAGSRNCTVYINRLLHCNDHTSDTKPSFPPPLTQLKCRVDVSPTDVSLTESSWMLRPLNKASLGYCAPDRCVPTLDHVRHGAHNAWTAHGMGVASNQYLGMGWFGQGHNSQGTFCPRDATSKIFGRGHIGRGRTNIAPYRGHISKVKIN